MPKNEPFSGHSHANSLLYRHDLDPAATGNGACRKCGGVIRAIHSFGNAHPGLGACRYVADTIDSQARRRLAEGRMGPFFAAR
jgi:hypothetical protein